MGERESRANELRERFAFLNWDWDYASSDWRMEREHIEGSWTISSPLQQVASVSFSKWSKIGSRDLYLVLSCGLLLLWSELRSLLSNSGKDWNRRRQLMEHAHSESRNEAYCSFNSSPLLSEPPSFRRLSWEWIHFSDDRQLRQSCVWFIKQVKSTRVYVWRSLHSLQVEGVRTQWQTRRGRENGRSGVWEQHLETN